MVTLSLSGYMFFGSALAVSDRVLHVRVLRYAALAAFSQRACLTNFGDCLLLLATAGTAGVAQQQSSACLTGVVCTL